MSGSCSTYGREEQKKNISLKIWRKRTSGRPGSRWQNHIKTGSRKSDWSGGGNSMCDSWL